MRRRIPRTYYRLAVDVSHGLQGLGSDFDGVTTLVPAWRREAEYVSSRTRRQLHAPVLDIACPARVQHGPRYWFLEVYPTTCKPAYLETVFEALIRAKLSTRLARTYAGYRTVKGQLRITFAFHIPTRLVPARTRGHQHLFLEREISWERYEPVLAALQEAHLLEINTFHSFSQETCSFARLPAPH